MALFIVALIVFIIVDIAIRVIAKNVHEKKLVKEREEALQVSLNLDYTSESKTLKRVEVEEPKARILCVDDEPVILDSFRKILVLDGYCVDTVETGQEALGLIQKHSYDFVFTDLKMPAMDGVEVTKAVKHIRPDIDVVIITGYATVQTAVECMKFGAMDYVEKPFTEDELLEFTNKLLIKREEKIKQTIKPSVNITNVENILGAKSAGFSIPGGVFISNNHCWISINQEGRAQVGIDDFAMKLIGKVNAIEPPNLGMKVNKGEILFTAKVNGRSVQFKSPISGKVVRVNSQLFEDLSVLEYSSYHKNWVCIIDSDELDSELADLKIGKAAVNFYQEELEKLKTLHNKTRSGKETKDYKPEGYIEIGEMRNADDITWERYVEEFF
ncbi:sigma-54 dependent DNA-binding response regulator [hydrothermal vent metagenome]|uniref:Sigma-54 dependent DNA-binding response regulator n=1 Tax=hydrothermal vent metagenome TaxID=652676 RepID=A0A3B1C8Q5_9ZZZZ